ncbi:MAG TPA: hypothetical protein VHS76_10480 [Steroidobacteraceae bacterium]|jgi:hypothetical protein|nr:hypothetical protein [Steroidobacteraceae bacterium]
MFKLLATLILSLSGIATVVYTVPSFWQGWQGWHGGRGGSGSVVMAPEIDPASAAGALTLLMGSVLVLRSRVAKR